MAKIALIFLAGGKGRRFKKSLTPKQFLPLETSEEPLALMSLNTLSTVLDLVETIVVCEDQYQSIFSNYSVTFAKPGSERQFSVESGFHSITSPVDIVLIHDSARPFVEHDDVINLIQAAADNGTSTLATKVKPTIKTASSSSLLVEKTLNRECLFEIQTPQALKYDILQKGLKKMRDDNLLVTDDVSLAEIQNLPVKLVLGSESNIKITTESDFLIAKSILSKKSLATVL